jgi:hypothetical protein
MRERNLREERQDRDETVEKGVRKMIGDRQCLFCGHFIKALILANYKVFLTAVYFILNK